jgi:AraC-like DNA-binding protein/mannose-6-phosphate isomerase-like protein (cupin superfamily)
VMQAYREERSSMLSEKKIRFFKNIVKEPSIMVENHWHDSYEILFVKEGHGEQHINAQKFNFSPGTIIVVRPGDIHATVSTSPGKCEIDVLQFVQEYFGKREDFLTNLTSSVTEIDNKEIYTLLECINKFSASEKTSDELIISGAMFMLCGILLRNCQNTTSVVKTAAFMHEVYQYLRNFNDIKLESIARYFGYSPEHFSRKFHAESGISYKHYCEKIKIQQIIRALENEAISLAEIADRLEYSDTSSFIRAFKRIYGITPGAYRRLKNKFD